MIHSYKIIHVGDEGSHTTQTNKQTNK